MNNISSEEKKFLERVRDNPALRPLFFKKAKGLKWFFPLQKEGYFDPKNLPQPDRQGEYITIPLWDITNYLANAAPELDSEEGEIYHQEFLSIVENVTEYAKKNKFSNYQVWWRFAEILSYIPYNLMRGKTIDALDYWLEDEYGSDLIAETVGGKLLSEILDEQDEHAAYVAGRVLSKLFRVSFKPYPYTFSETRQKAGFRFRKYWGKRIIETVALRSGERLEKEGVTIFHDELIRVLKELKNDGYSSIWQPAIEDHEQNSFHDDIENLLVLAYRDSLTGFIQSSSEEAKKHLCEMLDSEHETIQRIAIYCIGQQRKTYKELWAHIIKEKFFKESFRHETWHFLNLNYPAFTRKQNKQTLQIIQKTSSKNRKGEILKKPSAYLRSCWLAAIKGHGEDEKSSYQNEVKIVGKEPEHPDFASYMTNEDAKIIHPTSPYTKDELNEMDILSVVKELETFKEIGGLEKPSVYGLLQSFKDAVASDPLRYLYHLDKFENLNLAYVHSIIAAYSDLWREKADLPWDDIWFHLLQYIPKVVRQKDFWDADNKETNEREGYIASRNELVKAIGAFIEAGARSDDHAFDEKYHGQVKDILTYLLENQKSVSFDKNGDFDALTIAINSPRGKCSEALIIFALRHCRLANKKNNGNHTEAWQEFERYFDTELKRKCDINYEIFALIPEYIPNFLYMSNEWLMKNLEVIFDQKCKKKWLCAMQGYRYMSRFSPEVYQHLKSNGHIISALDDEDLSDYHSLKFVQESVYSFLRDEELLDNENSLIRILLSRGKEKEIHQIILTIHSFRSHVNEKIISKVYELWSHIQKSIKDNIGFSSKDGRKLITALCLWIEFFDRLSDKTTEWLLEIVPYVYSKHDFPYGLLKELARISEQQPLEANKIWRAAIDGMSNDTYGFLGSKEEIKTILKNLVSKEKEGERLAKETVAKCVVKGISQPSELLSGILNEQKVFMEVEEHFKSGKELYESNDYDGAITNYTKTIELNSDHVSAWYNRGLAWSKKGEFGKAIEDFDAVLRLDPNNQQAIHDRSEALEKVKEKSNEG